MDGAMEATLMAANRLSVLGLAFLALAMIGAIFLITRHTVRWRRRDRSNCRHGHGVRVSLLRQPLLRLRD